MLLGRLRTDDDSHDYRWVDYSLLHVTLAFLGEQPEARLSALETLGAEAAAGSKASVLRLGSAGHFGSARAPRVLWVDLAGDLTALTALQSRLASGLKRHGFPTEERPFRPHITLARRRESAHGGPPAGWPPEVEHATIPLRELTLMHSQLSSRGPAYTPVCRFPLGRG